MIAKPCPIPDDALDDRQGFVGTSGSGKTFGAGVAAERLLNRKSRIIIPDALGVWWGLRVMADGKEPSPWPVVIFGGPHGDLPITEASGALIGEACASMAESAIVDLSEIGTKAGERRFMLAFLTALYRKASGEPVHVIFDEADMWAPQQVRDKDGEAAKLLGMMETIVRRGRVKGFIPWLITQRPAVLNKDVLSQVDGLAAFKLTSTQDRDALSAWVEGQADKVTWRKTYGELAGLERGRAVIWQPGHGELDVAQFPRKISFDSSASPKRGEKKRTATLKPLDLPALKEKLAAIRAEAEATDPRKLQKEVERLTRELAKKAPSDAPNPGAIADAEARGEERGRLAGFTEGFAAGEAKGRSGIGQAIAALQRFLGTKPDATAAQVYAPRALKDAPDVSRHATPPAPRAASPPNTQADGSLPRGEWQCLTAIAQHQRGVTRPQLTVLTGFKRSTRDKYIQLLRAKELVDQAGERITATPAGLDALGDGFEPLPTGSALRDKVLSTLPPGEARVLDIAINFYPASVGRDDVSERSGFKRSTRDKYIQLLAARELITVVAAGEVRASDDLFDNHERE